MLFAICPAWLFGSVPGGDAELQICPDRQGLRALENACLGGWESGRGCGRLQPAVVSTYGVCLALRRLPDPDQQIGVGMKSEGCWASRLSRGEPSLLGGTWRTCSISHQLTNSPARPMLMPPMHQLRRDVGNGNATTKERRHSIASNEGRHPQCFFTAPLAN